MLDEQCLRITSRNMVQRKILLRIEKQRKWASMPSKDIYKFFLNPVSSRTKGKQFLHIPLRSSLIAGNTRIGSEEFHSPNKKKISSEEFTNKKRMSSEEFTHSHKM
jgi:hypothetical protein